MATLGRKRDDAQYSRLTAMTQPEATPTKRIGTEAPVGAMTAGPAAGKSAAEFTQTSKASPGSVFKRQLENANIEGITRLAEQPLLREFGDVSRRLAGEGVEYKKDIDELLKKQPQFKTTTPEEQQNVSKRLAGGGDAQEATEVLTREKIDVPAFTTEPIQEFTPQQALRGGTVESLIRKEAQGPYTTGMAGLDALLFAKKGGAGQLAQRGFGLRTAAQTAADILQGKTSGAIPGAISDILAGAGLTGNLTKEAQQKAQKFVEEQKAGLINALQTGATGQLQQFQAGLEPLASGRAATAAQQNQAIQQYYRDLAAQERTQLLAGLPTANPVFEGYSDASGRDIPTMLQNIRNVDIDALLQPYLNLPGVTQPTLADVAAQTPEQRAQYDRLIALLQTGGADVSQFGLGQVTTPAKPQMTADEATIRSAIKDALIRAGEQAPIVSYTAQKAPSAPVTTRRPYEAVFEGDAQPSLQWRY